MHRRLWIDQVRRRSTDRGESRRLFQDAGNPDEQVGDHVAAICFVPFDTVSIRLNSAFLHDAIALAEHDDAGLPLLDLMFGDVGEAQCTVSLWTPFVYRRNVLSVFGRV